MKGTTQMSMILTHEVDVKPTIHRTEDELFASDAPETGPVHCCKEHGFVFLVAVEAEKLTPGGYRMYAAWACPNCPTDGGVVCPIEYDHVDDYWSEAVAA